MQLKALASSSHAITRYTHVYKPLARGAHEAWIVLVQVHINFIHVSLVWGFILQYPRWSEAWKKWLISIDWTMLSRSLWDFLIGLSLSLEASFLLYSLTAWRCLSTSRAPSLVRFSSVILSFCFLFLRVARCLTLSCHYGSPHTLHVGS